MTKSQENKFNMYLQVVNTCNDYQPVWGNLKAFKRAFKAFNAGIANIKQNRQIQEYNYTGTTKERLDKTNELVEITLRHISALKAFMLMTGKKSTYEAIAYTKTELISSRDTTFIEKCELVYNLALKQDGSISDFGITPETLDEFKMEINTLNAMLTDSKAAINKKKLATEKLVALFAGCDALLKGQLDNLMFMFKKEHPDFNRAYQFSRKIAHLGFRHNNDNEANQDKQAA